MKKLLALLLAMLMVFTMVACSANKETPATDEPETETPATEAPAEEEVPAEEEAPAKPYEGITLTFSTYIAKDEATDYAVLSEIFQGFEEATGAKVEIVLNDASNQVPQLVANLSAGSGPDVMGYGGANEATLIANGFLEDVDSYFTEEEKADWIYYENAAINGGHYCIPYVGGASYRVIMMNKTLCEELGLEVPDYENFTWDTLLTYGKAAVDAGYKGYVAPWSGNANAPMCNYINFLYQAAGSILDENGDYALNSPESIAAMSFINDIFNTYGICDTVSYDNDGAIAEFAEGKTLFLGTGVWNVAALPDTFEIEAYHMQGERYGCANAVDYLSINSASENKEAAAALVSWFMSAENWTKYDAATRGGASIILKSVDSSEAIDSRFQHLIDECDNYWSFPAKDYISDACELMITHEQLVAMGDETPEEACQAMQEALEFLLAE